LGTKREADHGTGARDSLHADAVSKNYGRRVRSDGDHHA